MEASDSKATAVVTRVRNEMAQGLRSLERRELCRASGILLVGISSFGETINTDVSVDRSLAIPPFRTWAGFQFELLGRRLRAVEGLCSELFRRSSSKGVLLICKSARRADVVWRILSSVVESSELEPPATSKSFVTSAFAGSRSPSSSAADPSDRLRI